MAQNADRKREYMREYSRTHRERIRAQQHFRYHNDEPFREATKRRVNEELRHARLWVLEIYGGSLCECCAESEIRFLTIDHITPVGKAARRKQGSGSSFYRWLLQNGCPEGYRVLCFNCNCGRQINKGVCPHKDRVVM